MYSLFLVFRHSNMLFISTIFNVLTFQIFLFPRIVRMDRLSSSSASASTIQYDLPKQNLSSLSMERISPKFFKMESRDSLVDICERRGFKIGVEIGIQYGLFAAHNLNRWLSCEKYYMIDMWQHQPNYIDRANVNNYEQEKNFQMTLQNIKPFESKAIIIRNSSVNASTLFSDFSVDFVYLDARHDYCGVMEDLIAWYPKLKIGGILSGHDFVTAEEVKKYSKGRQHWEICMNGSIQHGAVKGAVIDFAKKNKLKIHQTIEQWPSWFFSPKGMRLHDKTKKSLS